jgi:uncharacterized Zn finger protein
MSRFPKSRFPAPSKPRAVSGGIKAQSKRGPFGQRWWAKRWIGVLEGFGLGARLTRGRSYARRGQVIEIAIEPRGVRASVQGSRKAPYEVTIQVKPLGATQWRQVAENISQTPRFAAMLLNGEIPEDIEAAFQAANCELFPQSIADVRTECSCPDSSNPCKHVAAVYYLIGEEFDRDPFLLFALRGVERDAILPALAMEEPHWQTAPMQSEVTSSSASAQRPPLERPPVDAWLLRRTGRFPFWHGSVPLEDALSNVYAKASESAATILAETWPDPD